MATLRLPSDLAPISQELSILRVVGSGPTFPFTFSGSGGTSSVSVSTGLAKINQAIHAVLSTRKGERVMRPTFGSNVNRVIFQPNDKSTWDLLKFETADALATWVKRIQITQISMISPNSVDPNLLLSIPGLSQQVVTDLQDPNTLGIVIQYVVLRINVPGSYIFPYSLSGEPLLDNLNLRFNG